MLPWRDPNSTISEVPLPPYVPELSRMVPKRHVCSTADQERNRALILEKLHASMSLGAIARALNLSKSAIQYVSKQFKDRQCVTASVKKGRPAKLSKRFAHVLGQFPTKVVLPP